MVAVQSSRARSFATGVSKPIWVVTIEAVPFFFGSLVTMMEEPS